MWDWWIDRVVFCVSMSGVDLFFGYPWTKDGGCSLLFLPFFLLAT
jgi:hypothetical protein